MHEAKALRPKRSRVQNEVGDAHYEKENSERFWGTRGLPHLKIVRGGVVVFLNLDSGPLARGGDCLFLFKVVFFKSPLRCPISETGLKLVDIIIQFQLEMWFWKGRPRRLPGFLSDRIQLLRSNPFNFLHSALKTLKNEGAYVVI